MSVINKMLKDLDHRQQPHSVQNIAAIPQQTAAAPSGKLPWLIIIVLFIVGVGFYFYQSQMVKPKALQLKTVSLASNSVADKPFQEAISEQTPGNKDAIKKTKLTAENTTIDTPQVQSDNKVDNDAQLAKQHIKQQAKPQLTPETAKKTGVLEIKEVKLSPQQLADRFSRQAQAAESAGNLVLARNNYAQALKLDGTKHSVRSRLAALYYGERNNSEAIKLLNNGIRRFPDQSEFRLLLAKIQAKGSHPRQALVTLASIADTDTLAAEKWIQQASIAQQQKLYQQAISAFKKLTAYEPSTARWWLGLGYNLDAVGQYDAAAESYRKALRQSNLSNASRQYIVSRLAKIGTGAR